MFQSSAFKLRASEYNKRVLQCLRQSLCNGQQQWKADTHQDAMFNAQLPHSMPNFLSYIVPPGTKCTHLLYVVRPYT